MRDELGPLRFSDVERSDRVRSLINRAVRLNNRAEIEEATIDKKGVVYCHDPLIETELQSEFSTLDAEMHRVGLDLLYTLGQVELGEIGYDPMHEDPYGTSDLPKEPPLFEAMEQVEPVPPGAFGRDGDTMSVEPPAELPWPDAWDDPSWQE